MATNFFFNNFTNSMEQDLVEDLLVESIKIYGIDAFYITRSVENTRKEIDKIFNETKNVIFDNNYMLDVYIKNIDNFDGNGTFMSKFGLEIRDQITFSVAIRTFKLEVSQQTWHNHAYDDGPVAFSETYEKPREGDLIFLPLNKKVFEIKRVNHEAIFYQLGSLQMYDLVCELFEFAGEKFDTGIPEIDDFYKHEDHKFTESAVELEKYDPLSDNNIFQQEADKVIDWAEEDPFSELDGQKGRW